MQSEVFGPGRAFGTPPRHAEAASDSTDLAGADAEPSAGPVPAALSSMLLPDGGSRSVAGWLALGVDAAALALVAGLAGVAIEAPLWPSAMASAVMLATGLASGQYRGRDAGRGMAGLVLGWLAGGLVVLLLLGWMGWPREALRALAGWAVLSALGVSAGRLWLGRWIAAHAGQVARCRRIAVLGSGNAGPLLAAIGAQGGGAEGRDADVVLSVHLADDVLPDAVVVQRLQREAAAGRLDAVVVAMPWTVPGLAAQSCAALRHLTADLWLVADPRSPAAFAVPCGPVAGVAMLPVALRPLAGWRGVVKRAEDLVLASLLVVALAPVLLLVAAVVAADSRGPVILRQRRFGFGNVPFLIYKFRTMYHDQGDQSGARATLPGDQRVTRVGRFLRASSIDELPQLFNVLKGEMSLVGPRAHPVEMRVLGKYYHDAVPGYRERHRVRPGITGLAQVNGYRGLVDTQEKAEGRLAWDLAYIARWSVMLDLRILGRTLVKGFFGPGAF